MNIGIICYASIGGSGIVATELGKSLASRGHHVHVLSSETPFRLGEYQPGLSFHRVETPNYPLFREPQYLLALANKIVQVSRDERLDIIHAHYAVPHATAGYLARQILGASNGGKVPRVITTLHGTDITLLGADRSYRRSSRFRSSSPTASPRCRRASRPTRIASSASTRDIRVIPNFIDADGRSVAATAAICARAWRRRGEKLVIHVSNFRPVKRVAAVVEIFERIRAKVPSRLLMVGDGPDLAEAVGLLRASRARRRRAVPRRSGAGRASCCRRRICS